MTASRMLPCSWSSGSRNARTSGKSRPRRRLVVNIRKRPQFFCFLFRQGIAEEVAAADLGTRQILQEVRLAQWRMELDMKMKRAVIRPVGWSLVEGHYIGKRHAP